MPETAATMAAATGWVSTMTAAMTERWLSGAAGAACNAAGAAGTAESRRSWIAMRRTWKRPALATGDEGKQ